MLFRVQAAASICRITMGTMVWQFWQLFSTRSRPGPGGKIPSIFTLIGPLSDAGAAAVSLAGPAAVAGGVAAGAPPHAAVTVAIVAVSTRVAMCPRGIRR